VARGGTKESDARGLRAAGGAQAGPIIGPGGSIVHTGLVEKGEKVFAVAWEKNTRELTKKQVEQKKGDDTVG